MLRRTERAVRRRAGAALAAAALAGCAAVAAPGDGSAPPTTDAAARACAPRAAAPDAASPALGPRLGDDAVRAASVVALLRVERVDIECSGLGGTHLTLSLVALGCGALPGVTAVAMGGHGFEVPSPPAVGSLFVAGLELGAAAERSNPGWCLVNLPATQANVVGYVPARDEAEGRATLARLSAAP